MVDQSERLDLGESAPVTAGNEGDAQAVETCLDVRFSEDGIDASIFVGGQKTSSFHFTSFKHFQRWFESWVYRNSKVLPWIILAALCIAKPNSSACQVDVFHWNRALGKPASGVESDFKASPHPFGLICQLGPNLSNLGVRQFWFNFLRGSRNPQASDWVGLGEFPSDGFVNELGEEFDLKQGRVVADFLSVNLGRQTPANIRPTMSVSDLPRVNDALLVQERSDGLPGDCVAPSRISFALPVGSDVAGNPSSESRGSGWSANSLFFDHGFIGQPLSFSGVSGVVDSQASGFLYPQTGVQIAFAEVPERGAFFSDQMSHWSRIGHRRTKVKWRIVDYPPCSEVWPWAGECREFLPLHYEASLFPVENSRVGQESLISGCFLRSENSRILRFANTEPRPVSTSLAVAKRVGASEGPERTGHKPLMRNPSADGPSRQAVLPATLFCNEKSLAITSVGRGPDSGLASFQ